MDAIVTARVPVEIKEKANAILGEIGATPTQLINAAYQYVLDNGALPKEEKKYERQKRVLTPSQKEELRRSIAETTFSVPEEFWQDWQEKSYKEIIAEGRKVDYEALA